jgi:AcrR family transcriptional regulator
MIHEMKAKRKYVLNRRAEKQAETRDRIIDAAVLLHEEIGPKLTTISAIADRAGVERLTVYRHFPNELSIFDACSSRWYENHPFPDPNVWKKLQLADERTLKALTVLYQYFRSTEGMWTSLYRDEAELPALKDSMQKARSYFSSIARDLVRAWKPSVRDRTVLTAAVDHAVKFSTWQSLKALKDDEIARLIVLWLRAILNRR